MFNKIYSAIVINWRTTVLGVVLAVLGFFSEYIGLYFDQDPTTVPEYGNLLDAILTVLFGVVMRDFGVSDYQTLGIPEPPAYQEARK